MKNAFLPLPLGLSTFEKIRREGFLYVDKTRHAYELITKGLPCFLSRPRRFGKSLFVSTLREILLGNRELFSDLWIKTSDYQWKKHGVIALDFSTLSADSKEELSYGLSDMLAEIVAFYDLGVTLDRVDPALDLRKIVQALHARFGAVAILVDEYDSPILKKLHDVELARSVRDVLHGFFSTIKALDAYINFIFITGVSSFAKAGIFSGMNNLQILSMRDIYADICGYTETELESYFRKYIQDWADKDGLQYGEQLVKIKYWYNGYRFSKSPVTVYNPFSVMNAFHEQSFENFWFRSGTPTFLVDQLKQRAAINVDDFDFATHPESLDVSQELLGIFDVGDMPLPALMFQTGYLTVVDFDRETNTYRLGYPNQEVERSLKKYWLAMFAHVDISAAENYSLKLRKAFREQNIPEVIDILKRLFAHVPYLIHIKVEKFYHALLQMAFTISGLPAHSEFSTNYGRIDIVVELPKITYIIEVKFNADPAEALDQIEQRKYYERFIKKGQQIILLGISFFREDRELDIRYETKVLNA